MSFTGKIYQLTTGQHTQLEPSDWCPMANDYGLEDIAHVCFPDCAYPTVELMDCQRDKAIDELKKILEPICDWREQFGVISFSLNRVRCEEWLAAQLDAAKDALSKMTLDEFIGYKLTNLWESIIHPSYKVMVALSEFTYIPINEFIKSWYTHEDTTWYIGAVATCRIYE